jgi:DNA polymerase I-like protein with 3'-5' exonuclease and polymerase domains
VQNGKFDATAFKAAGIIDLAPHYHKIDDTLMASHLLASGLPHDLTSLVLQYLGKDISPYEEKMRLAVQEARRFCRSHLPHWRIAREDEADMPSYKASSDKKKDPKWKYDTWLLRALRREGYADDKPHYDTLLRDYANADAAYTLAVWLCMERDLHKRKLWKIYEASRNIPNIAWQMEERGVTLSYSRLQETRERCEKESFAAEKECLSIAQTLGYDLTLPKSGNNKSLLTFLYGDNGKPGPLGLRPVVFTENGNPSLNKDAVSLYLDELDRDGMQYSFIKNLADKRKRDTALNYLAGYQRFMLPAYNGLFVDQAALDFFRLHPQLNPTGTAHLRWSSNNPNEQNISKQEGFNLRYVFGPEYGREWYSLDAKNLELRIPAFVANEKDLIWIFEHPNEPPYYGSYHLFVFDILHPELFAKHGVDCKTLFEATWYQWTKNGNFSIIYGAQKRTADRAYHVNGAYEKVRYRMPNIARLSDRMQEQARKYGLVETIPDREVDSERGYPIMCARGLDGKVLPTIPLNYFVSGSACWWMRRAMIKCHDKLSDWRSRCDAFMAMQVHDEIVFDFPKLGDPRKDREKEKMYGSRYFRTSNLWRVRELQKLMESCGDAIGVPTPVDVEYHPAHWAEGVKL